MSMSVRDDDDRPRVGRRARAARPLPDLPQPARPRVPADAHRDPAVPPPGPGAARADRTRTGASDDDRRCATSSREGGFSAYFLRHFMEPLVAAVWSCDPDVALDYPARYLFTFLEHHGMLGVFGSPQWRTVTGGSREYVARVAAGLPSPRRHQGHVGAARPPTASRSPTATARSRRSTRSSSPPTRPRRSPCSPSRPPAQREVLSAMPYCRNTALLHTDTSLLPRADRARASWNFLRPRGRPGAGHRHLRPDPAAAAARPTTHYLVTLGGEDLVDPATVIDARWSTSTRSTPPRRSPPSAGCPRSTPTGSPSPAPTTAGASTRTARAPALRRRRAARPAAGPRQPTGRRAGRRGPAGLRDHDPPHPPAAVPAHLHPPLAHLAGRPRRPARPRLLGRFEARDHLGGPTRTIRANVEAFLAAQRRRPSTRRPDPDGRATPRALGYCFNPISVFWCLDRAGAPAATVVEVHNTYGDRHAYLVHPDEQGRARTRQADVRLAVPRHRRHATSSPCRCPATGSTSRSRCTPTTARVQRLPRGDAHATHGPLRAAPAALRGTLLIRAHGIWLWARRLPVRPRPDHHQEGV